MDTEHLIGRVPARIERQSFHSFITLEMCFRWDEPHEEERKQHQNEFPKKNDSKSISSELSFLIWCYRIAATAASSKQ